jgi:hypothetical protein
MPKQITFYLSFDKAVGKAFGKPVEGNIQLLCATA